MPDFSIHSVSLLSQYICDAKTVAAAAAICVNINDNCSANI